MIQRIQTLYMFVAAILSIFFIMWVPLWQVAEENFYAIQNPVYIALAGLSAGVIVANIFNFKKRKLQVVLNRLVIIFNFVLVGLVLYEFYALDKSAVEIQFKLGSIFPFITIIFLSMASKAIIKDEQIIKNADRLR